MASAVDGLKGSKPKKGWIDTPENTPAGYQPPSQGPFRCDNCEYFSGGYKCNKPQVVKELGAIPGFPDKAKVEPDGCCNFFEKL